MKGAYGMSQSDNAHKYEYLNAMSTEQLRELLQLEIESDQDNDELVLQILGVIKKRNKERQPGSPSWQQARSDFDKYYNTPDGKGQQLYPMEASQGDVPLKTKKPGKIIRLVATVAAVLAVVFLTVPPALGYSDVWDMVARWTDDVLKPKHIASSEGIDEPLQAEIYLNNTTLQEALEAYQITIPVVPTYYPDGYLLEDITVRERSDIGEILFYATFRNDEYDPLVISITQRQSLHTRTYEKNTNYIEAYTVNGVSHTIFSNNNVLSSIWYIDNFECSITANIPIEEMKEMIYSIYERA